MKTAFKVSGLTATIIGIGIPAVAAVPVTRVPHVRIIMMDKDVDIEKADERRGTQEVCDFIGKENLIARFTDSVDRVEQIVDCFYLKSNKKHPKLMHMQTYQVLSQHALPGRNEMELTIKAGLMPIKEILAYSRIDEKKTIVLTGKVFKPKRAMARTVTVLRSDCIKTGCSNIVEISNLGEFFQAGGIDIERARAWQMVFPPQLYVLQDMQKDEAKPVTTTDRRASRTSIRLAGLQK